MVPAGAGVIPDLDVARWDVVGPRVLTAGVHVNGPNGNVSGGLGAHLDGAARAEVAVELQSADEIKKRLEALIAQGVDSIEHLVNVPHELPEDLVQAIKARGITVCPTLSGSAYSVWKFLQAPELLFQDHDLLANVPVGVRKDLYFTVRVLKLPGVARLFLRQPEPMRQWKRWHERSLRNTEKLYRAGIRVDLPTAIWHNCYAI